MEREQVKDGDGTDCAQIERLQIEPEQKQQGRNAGIAETPNITLGRIRKVRSLIDPDRLARVYNPTPRLLDLCGVWISGPGVIDRGSVA